MIRIEDTHGLKIDNMNGVTTFLSFRYSYRIEKPKYEKVKDKLSNAILFHVYLYKILDPAQLQTFH